MDKIIISCPICNASYRISKMHVGKKARCKQCGESFVVSVSKSGAGQSASQEREASNSVLAAPAHTPKARETPLPEATQTQRPTSQAAPAGQEKLRKTKDREAETDLNQERILRGVKKLEQLAARVGVVREPSSTGRNELRPLPNDGVKVHANFIITLLEIRAGKGRDKTSSSVKKLLAHWREHIIRHYPEHEESTQILLAMVKVAMAAIEGRKLPTDEELGLNRSSSKCFIATAACGIDSKEIRILRQFRDTVLMKSVLGRVFVRTYYKVAPPIALLMKASPKAQYAIRKILVCPLARLVERKMCRSAT